MPGIYRLLRTRVRLSQTTAFLPASSIASVESESCISIVDRYFPLAVKVGHPEFQRFRSEFLADLFQLYGEDFGVRYFQRLQTEVNTIHGQNGLGDSASTSKLNIDTGIGCVIADTEKRSLPL